MIRRAVLVAALVTALAGCSDGASTRLTVRLTQDVAGGTQHRELSLRCHPTGGDMPHRDRLCRLIDRYPKAMLDPADRGGRCLETVGGPHVELAGVSRGRHVELGGSPACEADGPALLVYWAAARKPGLLAVATARLPDGGRTIRGDTGWTLRVPDRMRVERTKYDSFITFHEVTVASFAPGKALHVRRGPKIFGFDELPPRGHGRFPDDGVALRIEHEEGGPASIRPPQVETRLPIRLAGFGPSDFPRRGAPRARGKLVVGDGDTYEVYAWVGPKAPAARREQLRGLVASLRFPPVKTGQMVGGGRVLGRASSYPLGSFTPLGHGYLVHAPGGFYAIQTDRGSGGYVSRCRLVVEHREFRCSNLHARWDRLGHALEKPRGVKRGDPLWFSPADVTWDGHVLLSEMELGGLDRRTAARLWPH